MKKFFVEDVKAGVSEGGMACGPVPGNVVAEVCLRDVEEGNASYYSMVEVEGLPIFFVTDASTYDRQMANDPDPEFWDMLNKCSTGFDGYFDFFSNQEELEEDDKALWHIRKLLVYLVRADWDDVEKMKKVCVGKCLGEFEIPMSDAEQEYIEECEEEE